MLRIGLTGGIGSGKTTVARMFEALGVPVYYADAASKRLIKEDAQLGASIIRLFGIESFSGDELNRQFIAAIVFKDPALLAQLNAIIHPATLKDAKDWLDKQTTPYAVKEAALIFEAGAHKDLDYVIGVSSPENMRIKNIMQRDKISEQQVRDRMDKQLEETIKLKLCDFVLINNEKELLTTQVLALHKKLLALSSS